MRITKMNYILRFFDEESIFSGNYKDTYYQMFATPKNLVTYVKSTLSGNGGPTEALFVAVQYDDGDPANPNDDEVRTPFHLFAAVVSDSQAAPVE